MLEDLLQRARRTITDAFYWWLEGIRLSLPPTMKDRLLPEKEKITVTVEDGHFSIAAPGNAEAHHRPLSELNPSLIAFCRSRQTVLIVIKEPYILLRELSIPGNAGKDLTAIIKFELERLTPFQVSDIYFDYWFEHRDDPQPIHLCLVTKDPLAPLLNQLEGLPCHPVVTSRNHNNQILPLNLLSPDTGKGAGLPQRHYGLPFKMIPFASAVAALLIFTFVPLWSYDRHLSNLDGTLEQNRAEAIRLRTEVTDLITSTNRGLFLQNRESRYIPPLNQLRDLTTALPDDTWLRTFSVSGNVLQLQGSGLSAAETLSSVESSPYFQEAEFSAPVSTGQDGKEEFQIIASNGQANE